jgi:hypothetical protein
MCVVSFSCFSEVGIGVIIILDATDEAKSVQVTFQMSAERLKTLPIALLTYPHRPTNTPLGRGSTAFGLTQNFVWMLGDRLGGDEGGDHLVRDTAIGVSIKAVVV